MARSIPIDDDGYNMGYDGKSLVDELPYGLDQAILNTLKDFHVGRNNAISRDKLLGDLRLMGFKNIDEREVRACINQMRHGGELICSTGGIYGGYWCAADNEEVYDFTCKEFKPRAMDLLEQAQAMEAAAERIFGRYSPEKQMVLIQLIEEKIK
jgi:hypothetical protein